LVPISQRTPTVNLAGFRNQKRLEHENRAGCGGPELQICRLPMLATSSSATKRAWTVSFIAPWTRLERLHRQRNCENVPPPLSVNWPPCLRNKANKSFEFSGWLRSNREHRLAEPPHVSPRRWPRCRMHGGASSGPRTAEGLARSKRSRWKHGLYSAEALAKQKRVRPAGPESRALETDASQLNGRRHGAWGSSTVLSSGGGVVTARIFYSARRG
jgi:hypothetical protein